MTKGTITTFGNLRKRTTMGLADYLGFGVLFLLIIYWLFKGNEYNKKIDRMKEKANK